jgi:hypothetical protein
MVFTKPVDDSRVLWGGRSNSSSQYSSELSTSETTQNAVSSMLGYGSFSGADTKVVVHIPRSRIVERQFKRDIGETKRRIEDAEDRKSIASSYIGRNIPNSDLILAQQSIDEELSVLNDELFKLEEEFSTFNRTPSTKTLAELQTISWSIYRGKAPVRTLGSVYPRSYVRGGRTISGSMIFTVFYQHALHELLYNNFSHYSTGTSDYDKQQYTATLVDQLPPLDLSLVFANEYGAVSEMGIYGVDFYQEGSTHSIEDIFTENVIQYVARDLDPMKVANTAVRTPYGLTNEWTTTASQLMADEEDLLGHLKRRNPFI